MGSGPDAAPSPVSGGDSTGPTRQVTRPIPGIGRGAHVTAISGALSTGHRWLLNVLQRKYTNKIELENGKLLRVCSKELRFLVRAWKCKTPVLGSVS